MNKDHLISLVERAKSGDKDCMKQIIEKFQPLIDNACRHISWNERNDLRQHLVEKVIQAVLKYDPHSVPNYTQFVKHLRSGIETEDNQDGP